MLVGVRVGRGVNVLVGVEVTVGVFEGAGYATKGLYRPMIDCIMFTKAQTKFCVVCEEAMIQIITWYSD